MVKETIQIRIDEETAKFVNRLLGSGLFKTKSEALRYILSMGITAVNRFPKFMKKSRSLRLWRNLRGELQSNYREVSRIFSLTGQIQLKYIDTSVIVSALDPTDPSSISSIEALKRAEKIISELVTTELSPVLSRNKNSVTVMDEFSGGQIL